MKSFFTLIAGDLSVIHVKSMMQKAFKLRKRLMKHDLVA